MSIAEAPAPPALRARILERDLGDCRNANVQLGETNVQLAEALANANADLQNRAVELADLRDANRAERAARERDFAQFQVERDRERKVHALRVDVLHAEARLAEVKLAEVAFALDEELRKKGSQNVWSAGKGLASAVLAAVGALLPWLLLSKAVGGGAT